MLCVAGNAEQYRKPKELYQCQKTSTDFDAKVSSVLNKIQRNVYDFDKDGEVNCKDYAVLFKETWDFMFDSWQCLIVRNYNKHTGLNHLFVRVWDKQSATYVNIETWMLDSKPSYSHKDWCMHCVWGDRYDMYYNYYQETEYWLKGNSQIVAPVFD